MRLAHALHAGVDVHGASLGGLVLHERAKPGEAVVFGRGRTARNAYPSGSSTKAVRSGR